MRFRKTFALSFDVLRPVKVLLLRMRIEEFCENVSPGILDYKKTF